MNSVVSRSKISIYKKLLISFIAIITSLILVLSSLLYYNYTTSTTSMVKGMNENILSKISYSSVYMDNLAKNFCKSLSLNNYIIAFANSNNEDILTFGNAIRTLDALTIPNTYIHSAYIYNRKLDTFISAPGTFYYSSEFFDQEIVQALHVAEQKKLPILYPIPRKITNPNGTQTKLTNVYTYILLDTSDNQANFNNAIVLNVDADWLRLTITSLDNKMSSDGNEIMVVDDKGVVISESSPDMFMENIADQNYMHHILSSTAPSGTIIDQLHQKKVLVSYVSSEILRWKFLSITPYETVFSAVRRNTYITLLFCLIVLLIGVFFAFLASRKLYQPIGALINKTNDLETMQRDNTPVLKNDFLKKVINGHVILSSERMAAKEQELLINLNFRNKLFLYLLKIDHYQDFVAKYTDKDRSIYKYAIANVAGEVTSQHYSNEVIDIGADQLIVLVDLTDSPDAPDILYETFESIVADIQSHSHQYFDLSLSASLGYVVNSAEHIKQVYEETLGLSMYRLKYGHSSILTPILLQEVNDVAFMFPAAKEKQLIDALKLGNGETAKEVYRDMIRTMEHASYDNIINSIIYLSYSLHTSMNQIVEGSQSKLNSISIDFLKHVTGLETLDELERSFFSLFDDIIHLKEGAKDKKKNEIVSTVVDMIQNMYPDKNLSLSSCADALSISSVYLGKLFRTSTGKSVAEYITTVRMEHMKHYLEQTNLPINDILEKCGIEKSNYFYTTFKKYFGVSLTEYRLKDVKVNQDRNTSI